MLVPGHQNVKPDRETSTKMNFYSTGMRDRIETDYDYITPKTEPSSKTNSYSTAMNDSTENDYDHIPPKSVTQRSQRYGNNEPIYDEPIYDVPK